LRNSAKRTDGPEGRTNSAPDFAQCHEISNPRELAALLPKAAIVSALCDFDRVRLHDIVTDWQGKSTICVGYLVNALCRVTGPMRFNHMLCKGDIHGWLRIWQKRHLANRAAFRALVIDQMWRKFGSGHTPILPDKTW